MGYILKAALFGLIVYFILKAAGSLLAKLFGKEQQYSSQGRVKREGEVHIDHIPQNINGKFGKNFKGGEYVDYEEVKQK